MPCHCFPTRAAIIRFVLAASCLGVFAGCATVPLPPTDARHHVAAKELRAARSGHGSTEERLGHYLQAAAEAGPLIGQGAEALAVRDIYNAAVAEFTILLRSAEGGRLWNQPLTLTAGGASYRLRYAPASRQEGVWAPDYFTAFETPREVLLSLHDPTLREAVRIAGKTRPLAADFTAPLAFYPNPRWLGLQEAMHVDRYFSSAGLELLQPYDPERIPIVCVHGLISSPGMWRDTIDAVESDPELRGRFQFWAFGYPIAVPALHLRESLAGVYRLYPKTKDMVLISHSLGGLLSKMQVITTGRATWNGIFGSDADRLYANVPAENLVKRALIFDADPRVERVVFICVPHRGSPLADSFVGAIGISLIHLPAQVVDGVQKQIGHGLAVASERKDFIFPPSVHDLSPQSPLLRTLDAEPMQAPHHTVASDRGKGDAPRSPDGVVPYESSHLKTVQSEVIVSGPHGSCKLPETVAALQCILHVHLQDRRLDGR